MLGEVITAADANTPLHVLARGVPRAVKADGLKSIGAYKTHPERTPESGRMVYIHLPRHIRQLLVHSEPVTDADELPTSGSAVIDPVRMSLPAKQPIVPSLSSSSPFHKVNLKAPFAKGTLEQQLRGLNFAVSEVPFDAGQLKPLVALTATLPPPVLHNTHPPSSRPKSAADDVFQ
eukprot:GHVT01061471.1.p1 GENE.GHVT01061471.1~~GHVT01061471.1.p1  ORF type:complete len:176 (+),score=26.26 GHVT01061471.1:552-1079(+)